MPKHDDGPKRDHSWPNLDDVETMRILATHEASQRTVHRARVVLGVCREHSKNARGFVE